MARAIKSNKIVGNGISPVGVAEYVWLKEPQKSNLDDDKPPKYNVTLAVHPDDPEVKKWLESVKALTKFAANYPWKLDPESGNLHIRFSSYKPAQAIVDSHNNPLPAGVFPGSGSEIRIAYAVNEFPGFGGGINFYLNKVQVINMVERPDVKFEEVDGYKAEQAATQAKTESGNLPF